MMRITWTTEEERALARAFIDRRLANPYELAIRLFKNAADEVLPESRRRRFYTLKQIHGVVEKATDQWREMQNLLQPEPQIVQVEVPVEPDLAKVLAATPTQAVLSELFARALSVFEQQREQNAAILQCLSQRNGITIPVARSTKKIEPPKPPRVGVVGLKPDQFHELEEQTRQLGLRVEPRFISVEKSKGTVPPSVRFVIMAKHNNVSSWETLKGKLKHEQVMFASEAGIPGVMQKLRDIGSRQPRAAL